MNKEIKLKLIQSFLTHASELKMTQNEIYAAEDCCYQTEQQYVQEGFVPFSHDYLINNFAPLLRDLKPNEYAAIFA